MQNYVFSEIESATLKFWEESGIYPQIKKRNHGKEKFYFLQGPPYTSGRIHLGTAWNHMLKDQILRYKRMQGFDVWDRNGYDMHGLPTENKVQKKFDLQTKKDIEDFGVEKFAHECLKFSRENAAIMSDDLWKMGVWMNHAEAYMPIHNSFIEGEWMLIKKAHEKNRLYKGNKVMTWCKSCETALAKHELEYQTVEDNSIFVKFKVNGKQDEYLIIWTTTPWTIPFNLAVMVNPELQYLRAKVLVDEKTEKYETWIVSTALATAFISGVAGKSFEIIEEFLGEKLKGVSYTHPFHAILPQYAALKTHHANVHTVILSEEYVDTSAGTGLVHCAPGCGPEDYEVGRAFNIPPFNTIDELGAFPLDMNAFSGMVAKKDDNLFIDKLRESGALIETTFVEHEYAHCWRCKNPVIFRLTEQWFFKTEDIKDRMLAFNKDINWIPGTAKNAFDSWLKNLKDNSITKQRFWGTPVPIWVCNDAHCNKYRVFGSVAELREHAITPIPDNLHKPWIDSVHCSCICGGTMTRIPDVLDVWIDAGTTSWNCLDYPHQTVLFEKYFPADFIVEGKDQIRGWFNLLMVASTLAFDRPPFKNVSMHGFITDVEGEKMSKSLGNIISPYEIIDKYGVDTLRYYAIDITIGDDMSFSWDEVLLKHKNLIIFWNLHQFLIDYQSHQALSLPKHPVFGDEEKYMRSRLHSTIKSLTAALEGYRLDAAPSAVENLFMDLSRVYIQLIREKSVVGTEEEKEAILAVLYETILSALKMFSIVCPFITERMYQNLKAVPAFNLTEESIHAYSWPHHDESCINPQIETAMQQVQDVMQAVLSCRDKLKLGVRWPLAEVIVDTGDAEVSRAVNDLSELIARQVNVKKITLKAMDAELKVKPNYKALGKDFGNETHRIIEAITAHAGEIIAHIKANKGFRFEQFEITSNHVVLERLCPQGYEMAEFRGGIVYLEKAVTKELELEGFAREITRRVQQLRKDKNLNKKDVIALTIVGGHELQKFEHLIKEKVGADTLSFEKSNPTSDYFASSIEKIKGREFEILFNTL